MASLVKAVNAPQVGIDRLVLTGRDGDDERDLIDSSAPDFFGFLATEIGIVDLHIAIELVGGVALARDLHQIFVPLTSGKSAPHFWVLRIHAYRQIAYGASTERPSVISGRAENLQFLGQ